MRRPKTMDLEDTQEAVQDLKAAFARAAVATDTSPVKEKLAKVRKMIEEKPTQAGAASSSSGSAETNNALLDAIGLISQKMDKLAMTTATKSDVETMTSEMRQQTKIMISEAVDPLKAEVYDLKQQMAVLQDNRGAADGGPTSVSRPIQELEEMRSVINTMDPAKKRVSLIGFSDSLNADERIRQIENFMKDKFPTVRYVAIDNFYSGPYSDRRINKASYVEFSSAEAANQFLKNVKEHHNSKSVIGGNEVSFKPARTKLGGKRNHSIRTANELVSKHPQAVGKEVVIEWKERQVTVDGAPAFKQLKDQMGGDFLPPYNDLRLP